MDTRLTATFSYIDSQFMSLAVSRGYAVRLLILAGAALARIWGALAGLRSVGNLGAVGVGIINILGGLYIKEYYLD